MKKKGGKKGIKTVTKTSQVSKKNDLLSLMWRSRAAGEAESVLRLGHEMKGSVSEPL